MLRVWRVALALFVLSVVALALTGCAEPKIDTSTPESTQTSIAKVRESLPQDKRAEFDAGLQAVMASQIDVTAILFQSLSPGGPSVSDYEAKFKKAINGKTGNEIIAEAKRIKDERENKKADEAVKAKDDQRIRDLVKISDLEQKRADYLVAQGQLKNFEVSRALVYKPTDALERLSNPVVIELTVKNGTPKPISRAYFTGTLASPGRAVPWHKEDFNYTIPGGLEPGEQAAWKLAPSFLSNWQKVEAPTDAVLTVTVNRLDGADGKSLYSTAIFDSTDEVILAGLKATQ